MSPPLPPAKITVDIVPPSPVPIFLSRLPFSPAELSAILRRAAAELPLRPVRIPILGEYSDCFTGDELVIWLKDNVKGFEGNLDRAEEAAKELTEGEGLLRKIGEFGNTFELADDVYYQFRPKVNCRVFVRFEYSSKMTQAFTLDSKADEGDTTPTNVKSPITGNLLKRSNTFVNMVQKAFTANGSDPPHVVARQDAETADKMYRVAVRKLDRHRLGLEERIEETLRTLQRGEIERLRAVKTGEWFHD
jgi:hypothetical protein